MARGQLTIPALLALAGAGLAGTDWAGVHVALLADDSPAGPEDTWAAHAEATFTGYVRKAVAWGTVSYDVDAQLGSEADVVSTALAIWQGPGDGTGQTVTQWALVYDGAVEPGPGSPLNPLLLAAGPLDEPRDLLLTSDQLALALDLDMQAQAGATTIT